MAALNDGLLVTVTVVFQSSAGPLGFDSPSGAPVLESLLHGSLLVEKSNFPERIIGSPASTLRFIRWHASRGVVALEDPSEWLLGELPRVDAAARQKKANAVRERQGRLPIDIDPGFFGTWVADGHITPNAMESLVNNTAIASIWSHGEWGVFGKFVGRESDKLLKRIGRIQSTDTILNLVSNVRELPTW